MMFKSSLTTLLLIATLAILASAQVSSVAPTIPTTTTAAATGGPIAVTPTTVPTGTITGTGGVAPTPAPTNPLTAVPDFTSLANAIASLATARAQNPGFSPTPKPGANSASRLGGDVVTGLVMVVLSAVVAGAGTLAL
ncbi:hypothetical protein BGW39_011743 [Mortierella sp. 14UC]|nr:hypothetical protein BGW39_011743 [Mortierella sp. 14UC]